MEQFDNNQLEPQKPQYTTAILILSIASVICCCVGGLGIIPATIALVLAIKSNKKYNANREAYTSNGAVIAGLVISIVGILLNLYFIVECIVMLNMIGWDSLNNPESLIEKLEEIQRQQQK